MEKPLRQFRHTVPEELKKEGLNVKIGDNLYQRITGLMKDYNKIANKKYIKQIEDLKLKLSNQRHTILEMDKKFQPEIIPKSIYDIPKFK